MTGKEYFIILLVFIAFAIAAVLFLGVFNFDAPRTETENDIGYTSGTHYARAFRVIAVENGIVSIEDSTGNVFQFFAEDDWEIGDGCCCIMDNAGTPEIADDIIVTAGYSGF